MPFRENEPPRGPAYEPSGALQQVNQQDLKSYKNKTRTVIKEFMSDKNTLNSVTGMLMNIQTTPAETMGEMSAKIAERAFLAAKDAGEELPMSSIFTEGGALTSTIDMLFEVGVAAGAFTQEEEEEIKTGGFMQSILNLVQSPNLGDAASAMAEQYDRGGTE